MKKGFVLLMMMVACLGIHAQDMAGSSGENASENKKPVFTGIKNAAAVAKWKTTEFPNISDYLKERVFYPNEDERKWTQGVSVIGFTVNTEGELENFRVINSSSPDCDLVVIDALKSSNGMWQPATVNGQAVSQETEVAVSFCMDGVDLKKCACKCYRKAIKHFYAGNFKKAVRHFNRSATYCPYNIGMLYQRGMAKLELGDKEGALADFQRIHDLGNSLADNYLELAKK
jgi:tetratricopeptide (TPR) repeat protein